MTKILYINIGILIGDFKLSFEIFNIPFNTQSYYNNSLSTSPINANPVGNIFDFNNSIPNFGNLDMFSMSGMSNNDFWSEMFLNQQLLLNMLFQPENYNLGYPQYIQKHKTSADMKKGAASMKLSAKSQELIEGMSKRLGIDPSDLKAVIYSESGGNPKAVNPNGRATGLIQFMPKTAKNLGTSVEEIYNMSAEEQLAPGGVVERYLANAKKSAGFSNNEKLSGGQVYALVFMPAKAKQGILTQRKDGAAYSLNKGLDTDGDGQVDVNDLNDRIENIKSRLKIKPS